MPAALMLLMPHRVYTLPEAVYKDMTGTSEAELRRAVAASEAKYLPFFERGAGGAAALGSDLRNQTYYSFKTVRPCSSACDIYILLGASY